MTHPLLLIDPSANRRWSPVGGRTLPVPALMDLVGWTLDLLDELSETGRGHGALRSENLFQHPCGYLAWGAPAADAPASDRDIVALSRVAAARMGLPEPVTEVALLQWVGTFRISPEWMGVLRAMGLDSGVPAASRAELRLVVDALRTWIEPYASMIRLTMATDAIVRAERNRIVGLRRRLLLRRDHARLIEEHVLFGTRGWSDLVALCRLFENYEPELDGTVATHP